MSNAELMKKLDSIQQSLNNLDSRTKTLWDIELRLEKIESAVANIPRCDCSCDCDVDLSDIENDVDSISRDTDKMKEAIESLTAIIEERLPKPKTDKESE